RRDPARGELVAGGLAAGVERVFDNLEAILKSEGLSLNDVVRTTVYLLRMSDFAEMNAVYARRFGNHRPARSTVAVAELPKSAAVEIDAIARLRDRRPGLPQAGHEIELVEPALHAPQARLAVARDQGRVVPRLNAGRVGGAELLPRFPLPRNRIDACQRERQPPDLRHDEVLAIAFPD